MKKLLRLSRHLSFSILLILLLLGIALGLLYKSKFIQTSIRNQILLQTKVALGREIYVGEITGPLFYKLTVNDIRIPESDTPSGNNMISIKSISVYYNPLLAIDQKHGPLNALTEIHIESPTIALHRDAQGAWNIMELIPSSDKKQENTFRGKVRVTNGKLHLKDERGWGTEKPEAAFENTFSQVEGFIDFSEKKVTEIYLNAVHDKNEKPLGITGEFSKNDYEFNVSAVDLPLKKWGPYVLPLEGYAIGGHLATVKGSITKNKGKDTKLPIRYDLDIYTKGATLKLPFFEEAATDIASNFTLTNGTPSNPKFLLSIDKLSGKLFRSQTSLRGDLDFLNNKINLEANLPAFQLIEITKAVPALEGWTFAGQGSTRILLTGALNGPVISGSLQSNKASFFFLQPELLDMDYVFSIKPMTLDLQINKSTLYGGALTGGGTVQLNGKNPPDLFFKFLGNGFKLNSFVPTLATVGSFNMTVVISGKSNDYSVTANITESSATFYHQRLRSASAFAQIKNNKQILLNRLHVYLNKSQTPLQLHGTLHDINEGQFKFSGDKLHLADVTGKPLENVYTTLSTTGNIALHHFTHIAQQPLSHLDFDIQASIQNPSFFGQAYASVIADASGRGDLITLKTFRLERNPTSFLEAQGIIYKISPAKLTLTAANFPIKKGNIIHTFLPEALKPLTGTTNATLTLSTQKNEPLKIEGTAQLLNGRYKDQRFSNAQTTFVWHKNLLSLSESLIQMGDSQIKMDGTFHLNDGMNFTFHEGTYIRVDDFREFTRPYGILAGAANLQGTLRGKVLDPQVNIMIDATAMESYFVKLDKIQGNISYMDGILSSNGISMVKDKSAYTISGRLDLNPLFSKQKIDFSSLNYYLTFKTTDVAIPPFMDLLSTVYSEVLYRRGAKKDTETYVDDSVLRRLNQALASRIQPIAVTGNTLLLFDRRREKHTLATYEAIQSQETQAKKTSGWSDRNLISGVMTTDLEIRSRAKQTPAIQGSISIQDAAAGPFFTNNLKATLETNENGVQFLAVTKQGKLATTEFIKLSLSGLYTFNGTLQIGNVSLTTRENQNDQLIQGYIPLSAFWNDKDRDKNIFLEMNFHDKEINLLTLLVPMVQRIDNSGDITITLSGPMRKPVLNSPKFNLNNTTIYWAETSLLKAPFKINTAGVSLNNNVLYVKDLEAKWSGLETRKIFRQQNAINSVVFNGSLGVRNLDFRNLNRVFLDMNFQAKETQLTLNYPGMYRGEVALSNFKFAGPFEIPLSPEAKLNHQNRIGTSAEEGPVISGDLSIYDANIEVSTGGKAKPTSTSILFNLNTHIGNNVTLTGSLFGKNMITGFVSGLDLALAKTTTPVRIRGSLAAPRIEEKINIAHGTIAVLNRAFELLTPLDQKPFFQQLQNETPQNTIYFADFTDPITGKSQFLPMLNLTALTIIDPLNPSTGNTTVNGGRNQNYTMVLIRMQGPATRLTTFAFYDYESTTPVVRSSSMVFKNKYDLSTLTSGTQTSLDKLSNSNRSDVNSIVQLLLPELYVDPNSSNSQTEMIGGALVANQLDLLLKRNLLRPVEKKIAKNIGLYDLRFNYNVGAALINNPGQVNRLGVDAVSQLFYDNLFLRVRSDLNSSPDSGNSQQFQLSEIALTYFLLRNVSLNLSNTRDENNDFNRTNLSLKVTHEF